MLSQSVASRNRSKLRETREKRRGPVHLLAGGVTARASIILYDHKITWFQDLFQALWVDKESFEILIGSLEDWFWNLSHWPSVIIILSILSVTHCFQFVCPFRLGHFFVSGPCLSFMCLYIFSFLSTDFTAPLPQGLDEAWQGWYCHCEEGGGCSNRWRCKAVRKHQVEGAAVRKQSEAPHVHMIFTRFSQSSQDLKVKILMKLLGSVEDLKKLGLLGCGGFGAVEMVPGSHWIWRDDWEGEGWEVLGAQVEDLKSGETYALKNLSKGYVAVTSVQPLHVESQECTSGCITNVVCIYTYLYYINPEALELSWTILSYPHLESIPWTFQIGSRSRAACKAALLARRTCNWCATHPSSSSSMPPGFKMLPESKCCFV